MKINLKNNFKIMKMLKTNLYKILKNRIGIYNQNLIIIQKINNNNNKKILRLMFNKI